MTAAQKYPSAVSPPLPRETEAQEVADQLAHATLTVIDRREEILTEYPPLPYTTALLLEDATVILDWTVARVTTMAQHLFEAGLITYPRTDSTRLAPEAIHAGREVIVRLFGREALGEVAGERFPLPDHGQNQAAPRLSGWWTNLVNGSLFAKKQLEPALEDHLLDEKMLEAHEAIRPTTPEKHPDTLPSELDGDPRALYHLIWSRFLASLMKPARYRVVTLALEETP